MTHNLLLWQIWVLATFLSTQRSPKANIVYMTGQSHYRVVTAWLSILHNGWGMHLHPVVAVSFYFHGVHGRIKTTFPSISQVNGQGLRYPSGQSDRSKCSAVISLAASLSSCLFYYLWASSRQNAGPEFRASNWPSDRNNKSFMPMIVIPFAHCPRCVETLLCLRRFGSSRSDGTRRSEVRPCMLFVY